MRKNEKENEKKKTVNFSVGYGMYEVKNKEF